MTRIVRYLLVPSDRRANPTPPKSPVFMSCRLCWRRIQLEIDRVEPIESGYAYRCQHCESSFLLRRQDILALGLEDDRDSSSER